MALGDNNPTVTGLKYPWTDLIILRGVPLDGSYMHTIYFDNRSDQYNCFTSDTNGWVAYNFMSAYYQGIDESDSERVQQRLTYQRVNSNQIKVEICADLLYDCNYIMFRNQNYRSYDRVATSGQGGVGKWFFAFINQIDYINFATSMITYSIDVMQTYMFDYELMPCFVEREHTATDDIGDNIVEEEIGLGELVQYECESDPYCSQPNEAYPRYGGKRIVVASTSDINHDTAEGEWYSGVYSGVTYMYFLGTTYDPTQGQYGGVNNYIKEAVEMGQEDTIIDVFMAPWTCCVDATADEPRWLEWNLDKDSYPLYYYHYADGSNYVPHNNKMCTYPFMRCTVTNNNGSSVDYRMEDWDETSASRHTPRFIEVGAISDTPEVILAPAHLNTKAYDTSDTEITGDSWNLLVHQSDLNNKIILNNFPHCTWITDIYASYVAQNTGRLNTQIFYAGEREKYINAKKDYTASTSAFGGLLNAVGSAATGDLGGAARGLSESVTGRVNAEISRQGELLENSAEINTMIAEVEDKRVLGDACNGNPTPCINMAINRQCYTAYICYPKKYMAERIDQYFDMFGYAVKTTKVPNRHARNNYTYTKTKNCIIKATTDSYGYLRSVPAAVSEQIRLIYDHGITFWKYKSGGMGNMLNYDATAGSNFCTGEEGA